MTVTKLFACGRNSGFSSKSEVPSFLTTTYSTGNPASNISCAPGCAMKRNVLPGILTE